MNKDVIYPSMAIRAQEETINKLEEEVNKQAKAIQIYEKELKKHDNNWNELKEWARLEKYLQTTKVEEKIYDDFLDKIKELEEDK